MKLGCNGTAAGIEIDVATVAVAKTTLKKTREPQQIDFPTTPARCIQIRALSEVNGGPWGQCGGYRMGRGVRDHPARKRWCPTCSRCLVRHEFTGTLVYCWPDSQGHLAGVVPLPDPAAA